ncbi:MAG: nitrogen fixation protein NifQ [Psychromonas sp.]|jgi:nitrogen fixation protein NifQ|uniref:nitrogen fixation protein NifQ n=1 Tax=Psychromonas sp. TaxID=1884585 RepID=UPI0039E37729
MQNNMQYNKHNDSVALPKAEPLPTALSNINHDFFRQIIAAQLSGNAALPHGLGLDSSSYNELLRTISCARLNNQEANWQQSDKTPAHARAAVYGELLDIRSQERNELITLLCSYADQRVADTMQMAIIVATACLTQFHLWHSLSLADRGQLGILLKYNFPELHAKNTKNMRWKRFFYRCLCEQGGDYICRAPSCSECRSYKECFAE